MKILALVFLAPFILAVSWISVRWLFNVVVLTWVDCLSAMGFEGPKKYYEERFDGFI